MIIQKTYVAALALAGALAVAAATPSMADSRWGYAAGGFAAGALVGSAVAANANAGYYHQPYGHPYRSYGYRSYGYAAAPAPGYYYAPRATRSYNYAPGYATQNYDYGHTYNPVNPRDPDPRIGGSFKMNSSGDD